MSSLKIQKCSNVSKTQSLIYAKVDWKLEWSKHESLFKHKTTEWMN